MPTENKTEKTSIAVTITAVATLLTALGGLIYALKSPSTNPSPDPIPLVQNTEKIYHGNVGKLEATFKLSFDNKSTAVKGTYSYDKKQDQLYELSGIAMKDDLHLNELSKGNITANCVLKKGNNGCFSGKMFNNDGRVFAMNICE